MRANVSSIPTASMTSPSSETRVGLTTLVYDFYFFFTPSTKGAFFRNVAGDLTEVLAVGGDRSEAETSGPGHELLHRLPAPTSEHSQGHLLGAADLHPHGASSW